MKPAAFGLRSNIDLVYRFRRNTSFERNTDLATKTKAGETKNGGSLVWRHEKQCGEMPFRPTFSPRLKNVGNFYVSISLISS